MEWLRPGRTGASPILRKPESIVNIVKYVCASGGSHLKSNSNTQEHERLLRDSPTACVIAQQYSSATFFSPRLHSRKETFGARFKNVLTTISFAF
jgi:hypothetical protein